MIFSHHQISLPMPHFFSFVGLLGALRKWPRIIDPPAPILRGKTLLSHSAGTPEMAPKLAPLVLIFLDEFVNCLGAYDLFAVQF